MGKTAKLQKSRFVPLVSKPREEETFKTQKGKPSSFGRLEEKAKYILYEDNYSEKALDVQFDHCWTDWLSAANGVGTVKSS